MDRSREYGGLAVLDVVAAERTDDSMTPEETQFFDDMVDKIKVKLQPDFEEVRQHTTNTVKAAKEELGGKIDKIIAHLGI